MKYAEKVLTPMFKESSKVGLGNFGKVYTFQNDKTKVVKVFKELAGSKLEEEFKAQQVAWEVGLAPKPISNGWTDGYEYEVLVMERLRPMSLEAFSQDELNTMVKAFMAALKEFHSLGWSHGDIKRPAHAIGSVWDNVFLTEDGIKLLDYGTATKELPEEKALDLLHAQEYVGTLVRTF